MTINYGLNRVRFPAPVPVGGRIRGRIQITSIEDVAGGLRALALAMVEREGHDKPVCVAETVWRFYQ
jgi:acyl dehydratase